MGHGHKKTYELVRSLDAGRIILGDKRGFGKNRPFYEQLHDDLKGDWNKRCSMERKSEYQIGEHVLVKSNRLDEPRRAIIQCNSGGATSVSQRSYSVYVYDEGDLEEVKDYQITSMSVARKEQLEPRTIIVHLVGVVPAKIVVDLAKKAMGGEQNHLILTQDSTWTCRANRLAMEWLKHKDVKYLAITDAKSNDDGSAYGQIYRKVKRMVSVCEDENQSEADSTRKGKKRSHEFLSDYLCDNNLALFNAKLAESQLKLRQPLIQEYAETNVADSTKAVHAGVNGGNGVVGGSIEDLFEETRFTFTSEGSDARLTTSNRTQQGNVTNPSDYSDEAILELPPSPSAGYENHDGHRRSDMSDTEFDFKDTVSVLSGISESESDRPSVETGATNNDLVWSGSFSGSSGHGESSYRLTKGELVDCRKEDANRINIPGRLLVRGIMVRPPYLNIHEYRLGRGIVKGLETLGWVENLPDIHRIVAPNFLRGSDVIVIAPDGGEAGGKSIRVLTYILTVVRMLYDMYEDRRHTNEYCAPNAVIVVNSYNSGASIESFIHSLIKFCQDIPLKVKFVCRDTPADSDDVSQNNYNRRMIPSGVGILITTMSYLQAVMQTRDGPFLFANLRFLIFEEVELYLKNSSEEVLTFIKSARQSNNITANGLKFQIALSGSKWSQDIEDFYKEMVKDRVPMVAIAAPNQVLRYAKIKWQMHYAKDEENKLEMLHVLLQTCFKDHQRVVVACSTPAVVNAVSDYLSSNNMSKVAQILTAVSDYDPNELAQMLNLWQKERNSVFIISDNMLHEVKVMNATCIIQFDSPEPLIRSRHKRSIAAERFGYLWGNIRHIEVEESESLQTTPKSLRHHSSLDLTCHFLLNGTEHNFYQIYKFATSLNRPVEFPPELMERALMMEEGGLQNVDLCEGIRLFGFCNNPDKENCPLRHVFSTKELRTPATVPLTGEIKFSVVRCESPSVYQIKLKSHFEFENGKRVCKMSYDDEYLRRKSELAKYYGRTDVDASPKPLQTFAMGTWCVVRVRDPVQDYYARARVERVLQYDKDEVPMLVRVHCVDSAYILHPAVSLMYEITKEFREWSPLAVELILLNLQPTRGELEYRRVSEKRAIKMTSDKVYDAKIYLSIGNTVWVNPMVEYLVDPDTNLTYRGDSVRLTLINEKIADFNKNHWDLLKVAVNKYSDTLLKLPK